MKPGTFGAAGDYEAAVERVLAELLPSEREVLGLLDAFGPMDVGNLARAARTRMSMSLAFALLHRLHTAGLVVQRGRFEALSPLVVRWLAAHVQVGHQQPEPCKETSHV